MSFFEDDFYSTRVERPRGRQDWLAARLRERRRKSVLAVGGAIVVVIVLIIIAVGIGQSNETGATIEMAAAPVSGTASATSASGSLAGALAMNDAIVRAVELVKPTVVSVISKDGDKTAGSTGVGMGSGVIFQKNGDKVRIVTNHHVLLNSSQVEVVLSTGERKKAEVLGKDRITDLAVLEVDAAGVKAVAEFGDSDTLKTGEAAIAIGNPLGLGYSLTVTTGVISSPQRRIPVSLNGDNNNDWETDVIQTNAAINHGNSGGALVNLEGKIIGITSMKISDDGVEGLGFAIPINQVKATADSLIEFGKVKRPFIGVTTVDYDPQMQGVEALKLPDTVKNGLIVLETSGPAKEAGLLTNDVIVELDGKPVSSTLALRKYMYNEKKIGDKMKLTYYRGGKKQTASLTLGESRKE
ncbi:S1C family serine protease [Paenibacillus sp. y28]|uniref:S1C family serine protease n=1 Tax=Paenibacillus sp. y28 TaxID=3129110 RepID=UPI00301AF6B8